MLTPEEHKKNQICIIGKAANLTDRLSHYNKTGVHEVVYYKECKSLNDTEYNSKELYWCTVRCHENNRRNGIK